MKKLLLFLAFFCLFFVSCGKNNNPKSSLVVLINSAPAQQRYLRDEVIGGFEKLYNCKIYFLNYQTNEELINLLSSDSVNTRITLASVPFELMETLANEKKITPLDDIVSESALRFDVETYFEKFLNFGKFDDKYYYFPHKVEVPVLFYLKSKIGDAANKYPNYRKKIDAILKTENGFGLPNDYVLEENPNEWDLYDIFVIGYILANEEYGKEKNGRIFAKDAFSPELYGEETQETLLWEKYFVANNILNKISYSQDSPLQSYLAIKNGDVFMAYFSQNDCFNVVEGTDESRMLPYISDLSDVGVALVPSLASFSLDKNGNLVKSMRRIFSINGFGWGIPESVKQKELAYLLIQYLNNRNHNTKESIRFGAIPVREDVLLNMRNIYDERWLGEGYATAIYQIADFFNSQKEEEK